MNAYFFFAFLTVLLAVVGVVFVLPVYLMIKSDEREEAAKRKAAQEKGEAFLREEEQKPDAKVVVTTKSGNTYYSKSFVARYHLSSRHKDYLLKYTAEEVAKDYCERIFFDERYHDEDSHTYVPMCEIASLKVVKA